MKWKQRKTIKNVTTNNVPYVDLRGCHGNLYTYQDEIKRICDSARQQCGEHCQDYEDLTMEEKLLVDADVRYLYNEELIKSENSLMFWSGMDKYTIEKCLARLRKRDRKNDKRDRK